ncbi:Protein-arginine kinase [Caminicella sporogenes DSM 14501]|uniref:Protein-arginine kinase n=1 Tax=Caminicella sporogenes DSM 14501 TaxID=1121266 RepID=A0A1M6SS49_9FIRM|nr:protein arginine kinase [Caminicella sporogenes]RKD26408.1 protein arginine kinase [Caminicella sporogenes]WIF95630.1 protein arginine kinase [Caminicella sporogenes]SHK47541.1 Protein-arginine kinase [Caminicella sporogenes DSM 14501]
MPKWIDEEGPLNNVVISSRIRLARNLEEFPFPIALTNEKSKEVIKKINDVIIEGNTVLKKDFTLIEMDKISDNDKRVLIEKRLISPNLIEKPNKSAVLLNKDESVSIMINEEDHLRIQCLYPGFQLDEVWDLANKIDDILEENVKYAFDEKIGYLTSCPTNVGTGIRASVMIHLPALSMTRYIDRILQAVNQIGLTVRGIYGEGTAAEGNIYQISNQVTLGRTEEEIIDTLKEVTKQIISKEKDARSTLLSNNRMKLEDKICRSFGILSNARILNSKEALTLLSDVRLGIDLGIIKEVDEKVVNNLMVDIQPGILQKIVGKNLSANERDIERAKLVRERLSKK